MIRTYIIITLAISLLISPLFGQETSGISPVQSVDEILKHSNIQSIYIDEDEVLRSLASKSPVVSLPFLSSNRDFNIQEFSIYGTAKNPYPEIKTYKIHSVDDPSLSGRITQGPIGINIIYLKNGQIIRIYNPEPNVKKENRKYLQEIGVNVEDKTLHSCETHHDYNELPEIKEDKLDEIPEESEILKRNGSTKRIYRAAIICTGEYYVRNGGGSTAIRNLMISNLNDISAIFEKDLGVEMVMATGSPRLETDINTDPFDPNGPSRTSQAQSAVSSAFPISRYDVGHVFHNHQSGDGWATGGVAGLGVICNNNRKASGWSGSFNNTTNGFIQLAAHEFGHMYNATHTFNGSGDANCTPNISAVSNYEIGSGTTIMSYQGLCDAAQNIPGSGVADNYFHINSLERMVLYMENNGECNTTEWIQDNNNEPVANANPCGAVYILPRRTPFMLMGEGTDIDGDIMTYCWEQYDEDGPSGTPTIGLIGTSAATNAICPLYRSYPPTANPIRYIPNLDNLRNNVNSDFEVLTQRSRAIKFRLTVRDNNPAGGAIDWDQIQINTRNSGPLVVTSPTAGEIIQAGTQMEVTWNTNARPGEDMCDRAVIKLSTDGGLTFPLVLAEDIDYDTGSAMINVPSSYPNTENARVMVACDDYECFAFFDINNSDFTIESNCFAPSNTLCDTDAEEFDFGDPGLNLGLEAIQGTVFSNLLGPIGSGLPTMSPAVNNEDGNCTRISQINNPFLETRFSVTESGTYVFTMDNNIADNVTAYTIFDGENFSPLDACSSFIESNANYINQAYTFGLTITAELEACKEYVFASQVTSGSSQNLAITNITGPGLTIMSEDVDDYELTFLAVEANTDVIVQHDPDSDFRTLPVGEYNIVAAYYKARGATPPDNSNPDNWIGITVGELLGSLDCFRISDNQKPVTVLQSCFVFDIQIGNQTACRPETNTYDQTISFSLDMGPGSGTVSINGQIFNVDGDQLTVTLTDLIANDRPVDLEFEFSDDIGCNQIFEDVFMSAPNCCPIDIDLGGDQVYCQGDTVTLDAGNQAVNYVWLKDGVEQSETGQFLEVYQTGNYEIQVEHSSGCINEDEAELFFDPLPQISLDKQEVLLCEGELAVVNAFISGNDGDIEWRKDGELLPNMGSSIEVTESGTYEITVITDLDCSSSASFLADFAEAPDIDLGPDILTCNGAITTLNTNSDVFTYVWKRNGFPIAGDESTIDITNFGVYSVEAFNENGCSSHDTINVDYEPLPDIDFGRDVTRCDLNYYTIEAEESPFEIAWYFNGELIPGATEIEYTALESGEYVGQIYVNDQCIEGDTLQVTYLDVPNVDFPDLLSACPGEVIELVIDDMNATFIWSSESMGQLAETSNTLLVTSSDTYYIEAASTTTFCVIRDTVEVNFTDIPLLDLGDDIFACDGEEVIIGTSTMGFVPEWYKDGELLDSEDEQELIVTESGEYTMRISSGADCDSEDMIVVSFTPSPVVELGDDQTACPGEVILLEAGDDLSYTYDWLLDGEMVANNGNSLSATQSGIYSVTVSDPISQCNTTDEIEIIFTELPTLSLDENIVRCDGDIYIIELDALGFDVEWYKDGELIAGEIGPSIEASETGEYIAIIRGGMDCFVSDTTNVRYEAFPVIELGEDQSACPGDVITLEVPDSGFTITWSSMNQGELPDTDNSIDVTDSDTYYVEVSSPANCVSRDTVTISFEDLPSLDLGDDQSLCAGETVILENISNGFMIEWFKDGELIMGENEESLLITESGTYSMIISANPTCQVSDEVLIQFFDLPVLDLGDDRSACPGETVELDAGDAQNSFSWSSESMGALAESGNILNVTESDTYYVEVRNAADCVSRDTITITFTDLPTLDLGEDQALCSGEIVILENNANGFMIEWYRDGDLILGEDTESLQVSESGTYTMVIAANPTCQVSDEVVIDFFDQPVLDLGDDRAACPGETVELDAGDAQNSFSWSSESMGPLAETGNILSVTESDTYYVEVRNDADCISRDTVTITFTELPDLDLGEDITDRCVGDVVILVANAGAFDIEWQLDGMTLVGETADELNVLESGRYTLIVSAGDNCSVEDEILVSFNDLPALNELQDEVACSGEMITLIAGTDGAYQYIWSDMSGVVQDSDIGSFTATQTGLYVVEAIDGNGCRSSESANLTFIDAPTIELEESAEFCEGDSYLIAATSNVSVIEWYLDGNLLTNETEVELEATSPGEYVGIVGPGTQCEARDTFTLIEISAPNIDFLSDTEICSDQIPYDLEIDTGNGFDIQWSRDGSELMGETNTVLSINDAGTYSVLVTNSTGCSSTSEYSIEVVELPSNQLDAVPQLCEGESFTMNADSDGVRFEWLRDGQLIGGETGNSLDINEGGTYSFVSYNTLDCATTTDFDVSIDPLPMVDLGNPERSACEGEEIILTTEDQSGYEYTWFRDGVVINGETSNELSISNDGIYSVEVVNEFGCSLTDLSTVMFFTPPSLSAPTDAEYCEGGSVELSIQTDAPIVDWTLNGQSIAQNTQSINADQAGTYVVNVESADGCELSESIEVVENANPSISIDDIQLCPGETQTISLDNSFTEYIWTGITANGSEVDIDYQTVNSVTTENASVMVTDNNGCSSTESFTITYNPELDAQILANNVSICIGESAQLQVSGGQYYEWDDPTGTLNATNIANPTAQPTTSSSYSVSITDDCPNNFASFDVTVNVNPLPIANAGQDTCTLAGADLRLMASGGEQYRWNNSDLIVGSSTSSTVIVNIEEDTVFTVQVIDENGCVSSDSVAVCIIEDPLQVLTAVTLITPNGDFSNDELVFNGLEAFPENKLTIFNRWGNVIFQKNGYQNDNIRWDGTRDGEELPADTYYYILEFSTFKIKKSITLLRD